MKTLRQALDEQRAQLRKLGRKTSSHAGGPAIICSRTYYDQALRRPMETRGPRRKEILKRLGLAEAGDIPVETLIDMAQPKDTAPEVNLHPFLLEARQRLGLGHKSFKQMAKERRKKFGDKPLVFGGGFMHTGQTPEIKIPVKE